MAVGVEAAVEAEEDLVLAVDEGVLVHEAEEEVLVVEVVQEEVEVAEVVGEVLVPVEKSSLSHIGIKVCSHHSTL